MSETPTTHTYRVFPALAALCYVAKTSIPDHLSRPWDAACAIYANGAPLHLSGAYDLPPHVQKSVSEHFNHLFSLPESERPGYLASVSPWDVTPPEPEETPAESVNIPPPPPPVQGSEG